MRVFDDGVDRKNKAHLRMILLGELVEHILGSDKLFLLIDAELGQVHVFVRKRIVVFTGITFAAGGIDNPGRG